MANINDALNKLAAKKQTKLMRDLFDKAEDKRGEGPKLSSLRDCRWTLPDGVRPIKDNWRKEVGELEIGGDLVEWIGKVVFFERWAQDDSDLDSEEAELKSEMRGMELGSRGARAHGIEYGASVNGMASIPSDLAFQDIPERNIADDLTGKPLEAVRVTSAKHEELTEMYRRQVWVEKSVDEYVQDTGKPPIPVRWVVTNKGDELHPNVRCRLVAKHLAAKCGGKDAEDLFAAMPPFELIKSLLVKAVQRSTWKTSVRKVMFIDISKAHLYAPVDKGTRAYVDLLPECSKPGTCGLLQFWLYGMRPASHGWEAEYTRQLEAIGFDAGAASPCCFYRKRDDVACVVHGDDFTFEGEPSALKRIAEDLAKVWLVKIRGILGPDPKDDKNSPF